MVEWQRRILIVGLALFFLAPSLCAYDVALRNGKVIHFQTYRVVNKELLYMSENGVEQSVQLSDINFERTRELNEKANPPLDLESWIAQMNTPRNTPPPPPPATPLGDVARQLRLKGEIEPEKRVFTNDDFPSSPVPPITAIAKASSTPATNATTSSSSNVTAANAGSDWAASKARIEQFLRNTEELTEQQYVAMMLGSDLADVQFPKRSSWQKEIYADHQKYVADAKLCVSDRVSDMGRRQNAACSRLDSDKSTVQSLREKGQSLALEWKSRQEAFAPH
jgi:hypothetical protein